MKKLSPLARDVYIFVVIFDSIIHNQCFVIR